MIDQFTDFDFANLSITENSESSYQIGLKNPKK